MKYNTVDNRYVDIAEWTAGELCSFATGKNIHIWQLDTTALIPVEDISNALLSGEEVKRSSRFHFKKDRSSFNISHAALRILLGKYAGLSPSALQFGRGLHGKPFLTDHLTVHFNISHSAERTLIAVASSAVGADIEKINTTFDYDPVLANNFNNEEKDYIRAGGPGHFFRLWTRKEALVKLTGDGLNDNLYALPVIDGLNVATTLMHATDDLVIYSFKINDDYCCSVGGNTSIEQLSFYDFNLAFYQSLIADVFPR